MEFIHAGDQLVVVKLDRLGRSTRDVLNLVHQLGEKGAASTVLEPSFSTSDAAADLGDGAWHGGRGWNAKFIRERQRAGIEAAKAKGAYRGRKPTVPTDKVREMRATGHRPSDIARTLGISRMSVHRALHARSRAVAPTSAVGG